MREGRSGGGLCHASKGAYSSLTWGQLLMRLVISGRRRAPAALLAAAALRILAIGVAGAFLSSTDAPHHLVASR